MEKLSHCSSIHRCPSGYLMVLVLAFHWNFLDANRTKMAFYRKLNRLIEEYLSKKNPQLILFNSGKIRNIFTFVAFNCFKHAKQKSPLAVVFSVNHQLWFYTNKIAIVHFPAIVINRKNGKIQILAKLVSLRLNPLLLKT